MIFERFYILNKNLVLILLPLKKKKTCPCISFYLIQQFFSTLLSVNFFDPCFSLLFRTTGICFRLPLDLMIFALCCLFLFFAGVTIRLVHMQGKEATK